MVDVTVRDGVDVGEWEMSRRERTKKKRKSKVAGNKELVSRGTFFNDPTLDVVATGELPITVRTPHQGLS